MILDEYFKYLLQQEIIQKNPMNSAPMIKKSNFLAAQNKEDLPVNESITVFTTEEIERMKAEAFKEYKTGKRQYARSHFSLSQAKRTTFILQGTKRYGNCER